ncbi:MAG: hypothetical protein U1E01_02885, partial [Methylicorpusculum sp.]|nr:hypothetical protein [Methylicorpusculum sp.]
MGVVFFLEQAKGRFYWVLHQAQCNVSKFKIIPNLLNVEASMPFKMTTFVYWSGVYNAGLAA